MTFTYSPSATPSDTTLIRYHIRDTVEASAIFTDEEIAMVLADQSTVKAAVISLLRGKIAELSSEPDFKADWLQVDSSRAVAGLEKLLNEKLNEFGISRVTSGVVNRYRNDSAQHATPDYDLPDYDALYDGDTLY